jgi:hypothetical protein
MPSELAAVYFVLYYSLWIVRCPAAKRHAADGSSTSFSKPLRLSMANVVVGFIHTLSRDLEAFTMHGKRSVVSRDDVLLCARRNPDLVAALRKFHEDNPLKGRTPGKRRKTNSEEGAAAADDGDGDADGGGDGEGEGEVGGSRREDGGIARYFQGGSAAAGAAVCCDYVCCDYVCWLLSVVC